MNVGLPFDGNDDEDINVGFAEMLHFVMESFDTVSFLASQ